MKAKGLKRELRKTAAAGVLLAVNAWCFGQMAAELPRITPISPEAAAINKYVNYPVNHSTGLVQIEIPLFEIKDHDLHLPITLSYHSSGLKVQEEDGWVGNGWTLNAEPSVSRSVRGVPDDQNIPALGYLNNTYYQYTSEDPVVYHTELINDLTNLLALADGQRDLEPDAYYFKLADRSGRFYINRVSNTGDNRYKAQSFPAGKENIQFFKSNNGLYFVITDDNGITYWFDGPKESDGSSHTTTTRWMGSSITSRGAKITFDYGSKRTRNFSWVLHDKVTVEENEEGSAYPTYPIMTRYKNGIGTSYHVTPGRTSAAVLIKTGTLRYNSPSGYTADYINCYYIQTIRFAEGTITFQIKQNSNGTYDLSRMEVLDNNGKLVKSINFYVSRYNSLTRHTKLDSIQISDASDKVVDRYLFAYFATGTVPQTLSRAIDHWGYHNGCTENEDSVLVPRYAVTDRHGFNNNYISFFIGEANRESSEYYMKAGSLISIVRPGRYINTFEYEANRYQNNPYPDEPVMYAGGLRIRQVAVQDLMTGRRTFREYYYGNEDGTCNGVLKFKPDLNLYCYRQNWWHRVEYGVSTTQKTIRTWFCNAVPDLVFSQGAPILYPRVEEYLHGGTEEAWKTVYYYNVRNSAQTRDDIDVPFHMDMDDDWRYGHLQKKEEYRYRDSRYVLAGSTEYKYQLQMMKASPTLKAFYNTSLQPDISYYIKYDNDIRQALSWRRWLRWGGKPLIREETGKEYFENGDIITTTKEYEYAISPADDNHHLHPLRITTSGSSANITERFVYPEDVENAGITENLGQRYLIGRNDFNKLLSYSRTENNVTQTTRQVFSSSYLPESVKTNTGSGGAFEDRIRYHSYGRYDNPTCISYENGPKTIFIWGYADQYPVARIENAVSYEAVIAAIGGWDGSGVDYTERDRARIESLRTLLPDARITTYTYSPPVGVISETDPSGRTVTYEYDYSGRLYRVRDEKGNILKEHLYNQSRRLRW